MFPSTPVRRQRLGLVVSLVTALVTAAGPAGAAIQTTLSLQSDPGEYIGQGIDYFYTTGNGSFIASRNARNGVTVTFTHGISGQTWRLEFAAPGNVPLTRGLWGQAVSLADGDPDQPGMGVSGLGRSCGAVSGFFQVKQATYGATGNVTAFWVVFAQHCDGASLALTGDLRFRAELPVAVTSPPLMTVVRGEEVYFDIAGMRIGTGPVTFTTSSLPSGATFSDNGDRTGSFDWYTSPDQVADHWVTFYAANGLGAVDSAVTLIRVTGLTGLRADSEPGDVVGLGQTTDLTASAAVFQASDVNGAIHVSVQTPGQAQVWSLTFSGAGGSPLEVGEYLNAGSPSDPAGPGLSVSCDGRACSTPNGEFQVLELVRDAGLVRCFRATFEQRCDGGSPALRGEIRYNAGVPIDITAPFGMSIDAGQAIQFFVLAADPFFGPLALSTSPLPAGAAFTDYGDNSGTFTWTPGLAQGGLHRIVFSAADGNGETEHFTTRITVASPAVPPMAVAGGPYAAEAGTAILFDGSASSTVYGTLVSAAWDFGDGGTATGVNAQHTYAAAGTYAVLLTVCNEVFCDTASTQAVIVSTPPPPPPPPAALKARAFPGPGSNPIKLNTGKPSYAIHLEPVDASWPLDQLNPGTIVLVSKGTGSLDRIVAASVAASPGDRDKNKVLDIEAAFATADLRLLLSQVQGRAELPFLVEGVLKDGRTVQAELNLDVIAGPGNLKNLAAGGSGTGIHFRLEDPAFVRVTLFDLAGRRVATLAEADYPAGEHLLTVGHRTSQGAVLAPGVYFYRLDSALGTSGGRLVLVR